MRSALLTLCLGAGLLALGGAHFLNERQVISGEAGIPGFGHIIGAPLPEVEQRLFIRANDEPVVPYVQRVNALIHTSTYHCQPGNFSLSWIEGGLSQLRGRKQFGWDEGILGPELLCGFCSQRALTLALILDDNGIRDARAYGLNGHVVVRFADDTGKEYLVDPDYGEGPYPLLSDPSAFKALVRQTYEDSPFDNTETLVQIISSREDDYEYNNPAWTRRVVAARQDLFLAADNLAGTLCGLGAVLLVISAWSALRPTIPYGSRGRFSLNDA